MINIIIDSDFTPLMKYELIYLASPYTKYRWGIDAACQDISKISGRLIQHGLSIYSPIAHTHTISIASGIDPLDHKFWLKVDDALMKKSDAMLIAQMPGWEESYGVNHEIKEFDEAGKPIYAFDPGFIR